MNEDEMTPEQIEAGAREMAIKTLTIVYDNAEPILDEHFLVNDITQARLLIHEMANILNRMTANPGIALLSNPIDFHAGSVLGMVGHYVSCQGRANHEKNDENKGEETTWSPSLPFLG